MRGRTAIRVFGIVLLAAISVVLSLRGEDPDTLSVNFDFEFLALPCLPCNGESSITIGPEVEGGTEEYFYEWSPGGQSTATIDIDSGGTYSVLVMDSGTPVQSASASVTVVTYAPRLRVQVLGSYNCSETASFSVDMQGGRLPYELQVTKAGSLVYSETFEEDGYTATILGHLVDIPDEGPGEYQFALTDEGCCEDVSTADVPSYTPLDVSIEADPEEAVVTCNTPYVVLDATVSGGEPPYAFEWSSEELTEDIIVTGSGEYSLRVTDSAGCFEDAAFTVTQSTPPPSLELGNDRYLTCDLQTVVLSPTVLTGGVEPYAYLWSPGGQITSSITANVPGAYSLTVTGDNGCSATDTVSVFLDQGAPTVNAGDDQVITCDPVTNTPKPVHIVPDVCCGSPPYSYLWSPGGATSADLWTSEPATYTVIVTGSNGCSGSDSVVVTPCAGPPIVDAGPGGVITCAVPSIVLDGSASGGASPYSYLWEPGGATTPSISVSTPGTYTLTVTGANGCWAQDTAQVDLDIAPPSVDAGPDGMLTCTITSFEIHATVNGGTPPYTYFWSPGGQVTRDLVVDQVGTYVLTATGANGCSSSDSVLVYFADIEAAEIRDLSLDAPQQMNPGGSAMVPFSGIVKDDCCVFAEDVTIVPDELTGRASIVNVHINKTQIAENEVAFDGTFEVTDLTGCPAVVALDVSAVDCRENETAVHVEAEISDATAPQIAAPDVQVTGTGASYRYLITFSSEITDNCCLHADNVRAAWEFSDDLEIATGGEPRVQTTQNGAGSVLVEGRVTLSGFSCSDEVILHIDAVDCCGNRGDAEFRIDATDLSAPTITSVLETSLAPVLPGEVRVIPLEILVSDNRCLEATSIDVVAHLGDLSIPVPDLTLSVHSGTKVLIQGNIQVENPGRCPEDLTLSISAMDCCGNQGNLTLTTAPSLVRDTPVVLNGTFADGLSHWTRFGTGDSPFEWFEESSFMAPVAAVARTLQTTGAEGLQFLYQDVTCRLLSGVSYVLCGSIRRSATDGRTTIVLQEVGADGSPIGDVICSIGFADGGTTEEWSEFCSDPFIATEPTSQSSSIWLMLIQEGSEGVSWWTDIRLQSLEEGP